MQLNKNKKIENEKIKNLAIAISHSCLNKPHTPLSYIINLIVLYFNFCFNQSFRLRSKVSFLRSVVRI